MLFEITGAEIEQKGTMFWNLMLLLSKFHLHSPIHCLNYLYFAFIKYIYRRKLVILKATTIAIRYLSHSQWICLLLGRNLHLSTIRRRSSTILKNWRLKARSSKSCPIFVNSASNKNSNHLSTREFSLMGFKIFYKNYSFGKSYSLFQRICMNINVSFLKEHLKLSFHLAWSHENKLMSTRVSSLGPSLNSAVFT